MPKISVVIPTFNRAQYISECINSVLQQEGAGKLFNLEVLVVDDGSTDGTRDIVREYAKEYKNILYLRINNSGGPATPRNIGIEKSSGDLVAFLDSDDLWAPNKLKEQLKVLDDPDVALCATNARVINSAGYQTKSMYLQESQGESGKVFDKLVNDNFIITSSVLAWKRTLADVGEFNTEPGFVAVEDYDLWLRLAAQHRLVYVNKMLVGYRQHDANISKTNALSAIEKVIIVLKNQLSKELSNNQRRTVYRALARRLTGVAGLSGPARKGFYKIEAKMYSVRADRIKG